jgi:hypothetical protein
MIPTSATSQNWGKKHWHRILISHFILKHWAGIVHSTYCVFTLLFEPHFLGRSNQCGVGIWKKSDSKNCQVSWKNWQSPGNFLGGYLTFQKNWKLWLYKSGTWLFFDNRSHVSKLGIWIFITMFISRGSGAISNTLLLWTKPVIKWLQKPHVRVILYFSSSLERCSQ